MRWRALALAALLALGCVPARGDGFQSSLYGSVVQPGTIVPPPVNATGSAGSATEYARADHTHVSSILKTVQSTDASGLVQITYQMPFSAPPVVQVTVETASGQPYLALITSNTATALTVKVLRAQTLPSVLGTLGALLSFNVFGGTVGAGVPVHIYAAKPTQ